MPPKKNHIGEKHGTLEVIAEAPSRKSKSGNLLTCWKVRCSHCGCEKIMLWGSIRNAKSCGCIKVTDVPKECTCKRCGKPFTGNMFTVYCQECKEVIKELHGVKGNSCFSFETVCIDCGAHFVAGSKKALRCPECRKKAKRESNRLCAQRRKNGTARRLGGVYSCADCGKPFILKNGFQKYCPDCEPKHAIQSWKEYKEKYAKK